MSEAMQLLDAVFKTITAAISMHPANRLFFEEQIGNYTHTPPPFFNNLLTLFFLLLLIQAMRH